MVEFLVGLPRGKQASRGSVSILTIISLLWRRLFIPFSLFFPFFLFFIFVAKSKERISSNLGGRGGDTRNVIPLPSPFPVIEKKRTNARVLPRVDWKRRRGRISVRVVVSYAAGSRQVVEWNRYLLGEIITVLFLPTISTVPPLNGSLLTAVGVVGQQLPRTKCSYRYTRGRSSSCLGPFSRCLRLSLIIRTCWLIIRPPPGL